MQDSADPLLGIGNTPFTETDDEKRVHIKKHKGKECDEEVVDTNKENLIFFHFINKVSCSVEIVCEDKSTVFVHFPIVPECQFLTNTTKQSFK